MSYVVLMEIARWPTSTCVRRSSGYRVGVRALTEIRADDVGMRVAFVIVVAVGLCGCQRKERAEADAQAIASAIAKERTGRAELCPDVDRAAIERLRFNQAVPQDVRAEDPWGLAYRIECKGNLVAVTSAGPDKSPGTADDIRATAVSLAPPPPAPTYVRTPDPPPAPSSPEAEAPTAACSACNHDRIACLLRVKAGALAEGSEAYADPVEASKSECAFAYMACIEELRERTGTACPKL